MKHLRTVLFVFCLQMAVASAASYWISGDIIGACTMGTFVGPNYTTAFFFTEVAQATLIPALLSSTGISYLKYRQGRISIAQGVIFLLAAGAAFFLHSVLIQHCFSGYCGE